MRECVPEEPGDPHRDIDPRTPNFLQRAHREAGDPPGGIVPDGLTADQREHFGDVIALGAHGRRAPDGQPDRAGVAPGVGQVPGQQRVGQRGPGRPGVAGRDGLRVHGVEVAAGGQHVDQPAGGGPGRPGRDVPAVQRRQQVGHLVGGPGQPRHHLRGRELQHRHHVPGCLAEHLGAHQRDLVRGPAEIVQGGHQLVRGRLQQVDHVAGGPGRPVGHAGQRSGDGDRAARVFVAENFFVQAGPAGQRAAQPGQRGGAAAPDLRRAEHGQHGRRPLLPVRGAAEDVQPVADQRVLDLAQVAVDVQHEAVELFLARRRGQLQVVVQFGGLDQFPDLGPQHRQLDRVEGADRRVLIQQLLQLGQVAVGVGAGHRRDQVVDDGGVPAPLGLGALARVVDDERVDQRQVAEHRVGRAAGGQAEALAGQPLQRAVLAEVHDGVRAEAGFQPAVGGQVVVAGRQVGVVVDGHRVLAEPARRLDHHDHVPEPQAGQHDVAVVGVQLTGRLAPVLPDGRLQRGGQRREPLLVLAAAAPAAPRPRAGPR